MSHTDPPPPKGYGETGPPPQGYGATAMTTTRRPRTTRANVDVDLRPIVGFAVGLFVVTAVVFVLMYGLFWYFDRQAAKKDPAVSPLARPPVQMPRSTAGNPVFGQGQGASAPDPASRACWRSSVRWRQDVARIVRMGRREVRDRAHPDLGSQEVDPPAGTAGPCRRERTSRSERGVPPTANRRAAGRSRTRQQRPEPRRNHQRPLPDKRHPNRHRRDMGSSACGPSEARVAERERVGVGPREH